MEKIEKINKLFESLRNSNYRLFSKFIYKHPTARVILRKIIKIKSEYDRYENYFHLEQFQDILTLYRLQLDVLISTYINHKYTYNYDLIKTIKSELSMYPHMDAVILDPTIENHELGGFHVSTSFPIDIINNKIDFYKKNLENWEELRNKSIQKVKIQNEIQILDEIQKNNKKTTKFRVGRWFRCTSCNKYKDHTYGKSLQCKCCRKVNRIKYYNTNKSNIMKKQLEYYKNNTEARLAHNVRTRINAAIRNRSESSRKLIGCSIRYLKIHLESQFRDGMSWKNYGLHGWHIDHITPLSSGKTKKEKYKLCHYTNLQPLWAIDNRKKGAKLPST